MDNRRLIDEAISVVAPKTIGNADMWWVWCALLTANGNVYKGVCIDTISGMWFCAEHNAISTMITAWEHIIKKIVAVKMSENGDVLVYSPCWRCREFMYQIHEENLYTDVVLDIDTTSKLKELLPYHDRKKKI